MHSAVFPQALSRLCSVAITAQLEHLRVVKISQSVLSQCCGIKSSTLHCSNCAFHPTLLLDPSLKEQGDSTHVCSPEI